MGIESLDLAKQTADAIAKIGDAEASARSVGEIQAAYIVAIQRPRNVEEAKAEVEKSFRRPELADVSIYDYPRGNGRVVGKSVGLAREVAAIWTNVRYGFRILDETAEQFHIRGWALDAQRNVYAEADDRFAKKAQRKNEATGVTTWVDVDERDLRELLNKRGAIVERNAILKIVPTWLSDLAERIAIATNAQFADDRPLDEQRAECAAWLEGLGFTLEAIAKGLGHPLSKATKADLIELRRIGQAVKDGILAPEDAFDSRGASAPEAAPAATPTEKPKTTQDLKKASDAKRAAPTAASKPAAKPAAAPPAAADPEPPQAVDVETFDESESPEPTVDPELERPDLLKRIGALIAGKKEGGPHAKLMRAYMAGAGVDKISKLPISAAISDGTEFSLKGLIRDLEDLARSSPRT